MKEKLKWVLISVVFFISFSLLPHEAKSQPDPGGDVDAPIDGGLGLLVAAGVGYGIKKWRDDRQKKTKELF